MSRMPGKKFIASAGKSSESGSRSALLPFLEETGVNIVITSVRRPEPAGGVTSSRAKQVLRSPLRSLITCRRSSGM